MAGRTSIPLLAVVFTLTGGAAAWIHLLACRVGVSERTVVPDAVTPLAAALVLAGAAAVLVALVRAERRAPGALALAARDLAPALGLVAIAAHASLVAAPSFIEMIVAPLLTGWAAARLARRSLAGRAPRIPPSLVVLGLSGALGVALYLHAAGLADDLALGFSDVGDYAVRIENTLRGHFMKSYVTPGLPPFYDHFNPGLLLLVPLQAALGAALPGARFLIAVQAVSLAACGPLAYGLARRRLKDGLAAALVALAFVVAPAFTHLNVSYSYGFHPVTLALAALLGAAWAHAARRPGLAFVLVLLAWSFEETVSIATLGAGIALLARRATRRQGAILVGASVAYFLLATRVVMPFVNGGPYYQLSKYHHLGDSMAAIALAPFLRPRVFWGTLLDGASLAFVATLLAPWLLLPASRARWLVAAAPILVFACLRDEPHVKSIVLWYQSTILPWLLVGIIEAIAKRRRLRRALALGVLVAAASSTLLYGDEPLGRARRPWPRRPDRGADLAAIEAAVLSTESLAATQRLAARFIGTHPELALVREDFLPEADVLALDLDDAWGQRTTRLHRHARDLRARGYRTRLVRRELVVLEAPSPSLPRFAGEGVRFAGEGAPRLVSKQQEGDRLHVLWRLDRRTGADWGCAPLDAKGHLAGEVLPVGGFARATYERAAGEEFAEDRATIAPVADFLFFDYLELDRRGLDVVDALPPE